MTSSKQSKTNLHNRWVSFLNRFGPILFYSLLVTVFTWPLLNQLGSHIPGTESDAFVHLWVFNWFGEALESGTNLLFTDRLFFPVGVSLLNHNVAWFNIAAWLLFEPFLGLESAYTITLLLLLAFNGYAIYLFAKDITQSQLASLLAGVIGTTWPFITTQLHHPNLIIIGFVPLTMRHMRRFLLEKRKRDLVGIVIFISLIGSIRLQLLLMSLLMIGLYTLYLLLKSKQLTDKKMWQQLGLIGLFTAIGLSPFILPMLWYQLTRENPGDLLASNLYFEFTDLAHYFQPSPYHPLWGEAIRQLESVPFHVPFLGYTVLILAILGFFVKRSSAIFWWIVALVFMILALGPVLEIGGHRLFTMPHLWLYERFIIPVLRAPNRFNILLPIPFSILAAMGYQWVEAYFKKSRYWFGGWVLLVFLILFEYGTVPFPGLNLIAPNWYQTLAEDTALYGLVEVPMDLQHEEIYMLYQITHDKALVEGNVARPPREAYAFIREVPLLNHLDRVNPKLPPAQEINISAQLDMLASVDIRYIVLHRPFLTEVEIDSWREWFQMQPYYEDDQVIVFQTDISHLDELFEDEKAISEHVSLTAAKLTPARTTQLGWVQIQTQWFVTDGFSELENKVCIALTDENMKVGQASCEYEIVDSTTEGALDTGLFWRHYQLQLQPSLANGNYQIVFYQPANEPELTDGTATAVNLIVDSLPRTFAPPTPDIPLEVTYSDELALVGYDLEQTQASLELTLYWHALQMPTESYKMFVHIIDEASGVLVAQQDYIPQNWQYPTNFWEPGEYVADSLTIDLSQVPAGNYQLQAGIYQTDTGERLITTPPFPDNSARLTSITR